ncbi:MAG: hypothetical protein Q8O74_04410, partial [bacterium]|nr:hypothetical protein [bacterium]
MKPRINSCPSPPSFPLRRTTASAGQAGWFPYSIRLIRIRNCALLPLVILIMAGQAFSQMTLKKAVDPMGLDVSGDRQVVVAGREAAQPLVVQVTNAKGKPLSGIKVLFDVTGGQ